jgi:hypothetical protein
VATHALTNQLVTRAASRLCPHWLKEIRLRASSCGRSLSTRRRLAQPVPKVRHDGSIQAGTPRNCLRFQRFGMRVVAILQVKRNVRRQ